MKGKDNINRADCVVGACCCRGHFFDEVAGLGEGCGRGSWLSVHTLLVVERTEGKGKDHQAKHDSNQSGDQRGTPQGKVR